MELTHLVPPIAAATVVNVFLFALYWQEGQKQDRTGRDSWYFMPAFFCYMLPLGAFIYFHGKKPITGYLEVFGAAVAGQAIGVLIVYCLLEGFVLTRGRPIKDRVFMMAASVFMTSMLIAAAFT